MEFRVGIFVSLALIIGSLVIFTLVGVGAIRLRHETGSNLAVLVVAVVSTLLVLVMFGVDTARNEPRTFVAMILAGIIATGLEFAWKARRDRARLSGHDG